MLPVAGGEANLFCLVNRGPGSSARLKSDPGLGGIFGRGGAFAMAARRKSRRMKGTHTPRWRRLIFEQFEPRQLLANMAPSGADNTVTTVEDRAYTFSAADFGF